MTRFAGIAALVFFCAGCADRPSVPGDAPYVERLMEVTAYCDCRKCTDWERNWLMQPVFTSGANKGKRKKVGQTASGTMASRGTVAADSRFSFGTYLFIPGYGIGVVEDRGGAINGNRLDVFFESHKAALRWGRQQLTVRIYTD